MTYTIKKIHHDAKVPHRQTSGSAGYDLYTCTSGKIAPETTIFIHTGILLEVPYLTLILPRSGLASKHLIDVSGEYIPPNTLQEIVVCVTNYGKEEFIYNVNDRIAQMVFTFCN
ncbi:deoxyuridine 5'-triphosphate nucleotidohydrolase [Hamiltosporidium magnivora]|uniref:Deoxyuridine 5'-triphosphate nucleotidohydrolase n=1 Tax=Hamiltosporidium magnivora TaxID=148818 RepID=A0A4Q9KSE0_9MICR|nr:deoxyuridine 5'-triphosphate nucleotidohydrolase [Hamiltosporidium magnivora]